MVFIENDSEEIASLIEELHGKDSRIQTCEDVLKSLEADFQKFPVIRDYIEYGSPDEYIPSGEPYWPCQCLRQHSGHGEG